VILLWHTDLRLVRSGGSILDFATVQNQLYIVLVIAIYPPDVDKYAIDLEDLNAFLQCSCKYATSDSGEEPHAGTPTT